MEFVLPTDIGPRTSTATLETDAHYWYTATVVTWACRAGRQLEADVLSRRRSSNEMPQSIRIRQFVRTDLRVLPPAPSSSRVPRQLEQQGQRPMTSGRYSITNESTLAVGTRPEH